MENKVNKVQIRFQHLLKEKKRVECDNSCIYIVPQEHPLRKLYKYMYSKHRKKDRILQNFSCNPKTKELKIEK